MSLISLPHLRDGARWKNKRIGLLGGSFNPPHAGHVHISKVALNTLKLDCIWWLVTPQNPLKVLKPMKLQERIKRAKKIINNHPKIIVTALEQDLGTNITYDSIHGLKHAFKNTEFTWITGMDNALTLHTWHNWRELLDEISMVHITRPPAKNLVQKCPLRMQKNQKHIYIKHPGHYNLSAGHTYWILNTKMMNISSTKLRA